MEGLHTRYMDKWLLKANIKAALSLWKQYPQKLQHVKQMEFGIKVGLQEGDTFVLKVKVGDLDEVVFEIPGESKLSVKMDKLENKDFLVLTGMGPDMPVMFLPDQIIDFNVK